MDKWLKLIVVAFVVFSVLSTTIGCKGKKAAPKTSTAVEEIE